MLQRHLIFAVFFSALLTSHLQAGVLDQVRFGDAGSEREHQLKAESSDVVEGAMGGTARILNPTDPTHWRGGSLAFTIKVDPNLANYVTVKFWGSDHARESEQRLCLFIDGKQVGQRHLGEVDMLDIMQPKKKRFPDRFFYKTVPLPMQMTRGKKAVRLTIEGQGGIWAYAPQAERFQKPMSEPSRGLYAAYTHTDPFFAPSENEKQGAAQDYPVRPAPGPEVIDQLKEDLNGYTDHVMRSNGEHHQDAVRFLAYAYDVPWNKAYQNPKALEQVVLGLDHLYRQYRKNAGDFGGVYWEGRGAAAESIVRLATPLEPLFDEPVAGTDVTRRLGWSQMLRHARDYAVARRRSYTNQSMIVDLNIYLANRALAVLSDPKTWPESRALRLLHESAGVKNWSGNWDAQLRPKWNQGTRKWLLTDNGLTKELGYVGAYGEIVGDFVLHMYEATRYGREQGDPRLKAQLEKMALARAAFRYPGVDEEGYRCMVLETVVGWRDWKRPGTMVYDQLNGVNGGAFDIAVATGNEQLMGYGQHMAEDNQFFLSLTKRLAHRGSNPKTFLLRVPENYETIKAMQSKGGRLPMAPGQPDFVFADPEAGVLAIKQGDDVLYASLYWRARYAVNNLARVHYMTPTIERDAIVRVHTEFKDSGHLFTHPDLTNAPFSQKFEGFYKKEGMHLAVAGQTQPIARVPTEQKDYELGRENIYAGKGEFYLMEYGPYLIAMNCTKNRKIGFDVPEAFRNAKDLANGGSVYGAVKLKTKPGQTMVLYRQRP